MTENLEWGSLAFQKIDDRIQDNFNPPFEFLFKSFIFKRISTYCEVSFFKQVLFSNKVMFSV